MKAIIEDLKLKIAVAKEGIQHEKNYIEQLRSRRAEAKAEGQEEVLEFIIEDHKDLLNIREQLLSDLRYSLMYARRANGERPTDIDAFCPESGC